MLQCDCKAKPGHKKILSMTTWPVEKLGWQAGGGGKCGTIFYIPRPHFSCKFDVTVHPPK